jgi:hypothetical protein
MKKPYDLTQLTDELSKSVFFQDVEQAPKQQGTKVPEIQNALAPSNQITEDTEQESTNTPKHQVTKAGNNPPSQAPTGQSTKALRHFSSYLAPHIYKAWKLLATQREQKDYEILQEAVEQYLARQDRKA